jgi:hypothetical protein
MVRATVTPDAGSGRTGEYCSDGISFHNYHTQDGTLVTRMVENYKSVPDAQAGCPTHPLVTHSFAFFSNEWD